MHRSLAILCTFFLNHSIDIQRNTDLLTLSQTLHRLSFTCRQHFTTNGRIFPHVFDRRRSTSGACASFSTTCLSIYFTTLRIVLVFYQLLSRNVSCLLKKPNKKINNGFMREKRGATAEFRKRDVRFYYTI